MQPLDLFIGSVSAIFGIALIAGAVLDGPWLMSLAKPQLIVRAIGQPAARAVIGLLGIGLIAIGITIASGWRMKWQ